MKKVFKTKDEWLKAKESRYGGTEASAIFGLDKWRTPRDIWMLKKGLQTPDEPSFRMKLGSAIEDGVATLFADETGINLIKSSAKIEYYIHDDYDFIGGSPDRRFWYVDKDEKRKQGVLEIKTTSSTFDHENYPDNWDIQLQFYLGLTKLKKGYITWLELKNTELKWVEVDADPEMFQAIVNEIIKFHNDYVLADVEPPIETAGDVINKYPFSKPNKKIDSSQIADYDIETAYSKLCEFNERIKPYNEEIENIKERIKICMLDAEVLTAHEQVLFTWKSTADKEVFDDKKFLTEHPEYFDQYKVLKRGVRRFLIKT